MRVVFIALIIYSQPVFGQSLQDRKDSVLHFNGFFRIGQFPEGLKYFSIPKKLNDQSYELTFYSLDSILIATCEYKRKNFKTRDGIFVLYSSAGKIIVTANYRNGELNGIYQKYYDNGKLADSGNFSRGAPLGLWKSWYPSGQPSEARNFLFYKGRRSLLYTALDKEYKSWYPDGNLKDSGYYSNNFRNGIWIEWIESGKIRSLGEYKNDWKKGLWKFYNTNGKLLYLRRYSSFKKDDVGERIEIND